MEIAIKVGKRWRNNEELLIGRIARVVGSDEADVVPQAHGYKWNLNAFTNDWKASGIEEDGTVKIAYRYGQEPVMEALRTFLQWSLGDE